MRLAAALLASVTLMSAAGPVPALSAEAPLIERAKLFGNPTRAAGRLSPDGKWLSWVAPRDGVLNVWIAPVADPAKARAMTAEKARPVAGYYWAPDSSMILFVTDKGGDENYLLYGVDVVSGVQKTLTPFEKTRVMISGTSPLVKDRILVGLNNRDPRFHDVHSLNLKTGELTLLVKNDGYAGFIADPQLEVRKALRQRSDGGMDLFEVKDGKVAATPSEQIAFEDSMTTQPAGYSTDGKVLYWVDSRGRNTAAVIAQDLTTGAKTIVAEDPKADIGSAMLNPTTGRIEAYGVNYLRNEWIPVGDAVKADLAFLKAQLKGQFSVTSRTDADDLWTVGVDPVTGPTTQYLYDRKAKTLTKLYVTRPELEGATLAAMHPVEIRSRDGLTQVAYLSLPPGSDSDGDGKPDKPVPLVLLVHGGPWGRDGYGYNGLHQWLANRGYAVLSTNFRGSTGFGKAYLNAGDKEWAGKMHDDLIDAVDWAVKTGVTSRDKVAIMGGSYGGYATLVGLTFTPETFACGVDIVGPSNLNTLLSTIPPYWEAMKSQFANRVGDPATPEGQALLKERSPLTRADAIRRPLLIGQGANDPRVKQAESDQIVKAMEAKKIPVTYLLFPDEGHGFARPENAIAFNAATEHFLERCLGGRSEPYGQALKGSSMVVSHGGAFTPGLEAAVAANGPPKP